MIDVIFELVSEIIGSGRFLIAIGVFFLVTRILRAYTATDFEMITSGCIADGNSVQIGAKNEKEIEEQEPQDGRCGYCQTIPDDDWKKPYCPSCGAPIYHIQKG